MNLSWPRIFTVARREFLTTVRRKAFVFTVIGTPAYFAFVMWISTAAEMRERGDVMRELASIALVDSSGLFANASDEMLTEIQAGGPFTPSSGPGAAAARAAPAQSFSTKIVLFTDAAKAEAALRAKQVSQMIVIPANYLSTGHLRRYARTSSLFTSVDRREISSWLARNMITGRVDPALAARVSRPAENAQLFTLSKEGRFELKDDRRELVDFMLPMMFTVLLGVSITLGGQYLLQGVAEEKESRILESLLCTVSSEELMTGKLLGLGGAGLLVVAIWTVMGAALAVPVFAALQLTLPPWLLMLAFAYFLLGYLFYGSLMTGIGAVTTSMREAQQFAIWFTFANFVPLIMITSILGRPNSTLAVVLSLFPPTAATTMMLRLTSPGSVIPPWQVATSILLLAASGFFCLLVSARIFRVGLLLYGKTPNLPEILRWARKSP